MVNILRDQGAPVFQNLPYYKPIVHSYPVNSLVQVVRAVDADLKGELVYEITGDVPSTSFFTLTNEKSGRIILKNDLKMDTFSTTR